MTTPMRTPQSQATRGPKSYSVNKPYPVRLADRLKVGNKNSKSIYSNINTQLDPSIRLGATAVAASIEPVPSNPDSIELNVSHRNQAESTRYPGTLSNATSKDKRYTLTFEPASQSYILDRVDATITITDSHEPPTANNSARDASANSDTDTIGPAEDNNPFDWRHQFRKRRSSSPDPPNFSERDSPMLRTTTMPSKPAPTSHPALSAKSAKPTKRRPVRRASTPPDSVPVPKAPASDGGSSAGGDIDFDIEFEDEKPQRGRGALAAVFSDRQQPRSLASVASSRSRSRQPIGRKQLGDDHGLDIDFDHSSPPASEIGGRSDFDVSEAELGSPVHKQREQEEIVVEREEEPSHGVQIQAPVEEEEEEEEEVAVVEEEVEVEEVEGDDNDEMEDDMLEAFGELEDESKVPDEDSEISEED